MTRMHTRGSNGKWRRVLQLAMVSWLQKLFPIAILPVAVLLLQ